MLASQGIGSLQMWEGQCLKENENLSESQADSDECLDDKVKQQVSLLLNIKKDHILDEFLIFKRVLTGTL